MRYLRAGGIILSLGTLLAGMALQTDALIDAALLICLGAMALCFLEQPAQRAALIAPALCFTAAALSFLAVQTADPFLTVPGAAGERIVPAGESARRTLGACLYALLAGAWLGETLLEGLIGKNAFGSRAGWAGAPVRICAALSALIGMAACLVPGLTEWIAMPDAVQTVLGLFRALAAGGLACYIASARSKIAASAAIALYIACAVFDPNQFALHLFNAIVLSLLLCAKSDGRAGLLCLLPAAAAIAAVWSYRVDGSALSLYAENLSASVLRFAQPSGLEWVPAVYARFGVLGFAALGFGCGALLFLLGRLLRDSFLYSAPVLWLLGWGGLVLFKGVSSAPQIRDIVAFFVPFGLCLIVGCIRRANARKR